MPLSRYLRAMGLWSAVGLLSPACARAESPQVAYELVVQDPARQYLDVSMTVKDPSGRSTKLAMPAWAPGSYLVRDFGRHVYDVGATTVDGKPLAVRRVDKQTWSVDSGGRNFRFTYRVFADELSVRTSYLDSEFAFLNGTSVFMYLVGDLDAKSRLEVDVPEGWDVFAPMPAAATGDGYENENYDRLADRPLLLGKAQVETFEVGGTTFRYVLSAPYGMPNADLERLVSEAEQVVTAFHEVMGSFPFPEYTFFTIFDPGGGGGLEHLESTGMIMRPSAFDEPEKGYRRARSLLAHEFFHAWNVKAIHDKVLGPFDYEQENYTELLWFHEGLTETMEGQIMMRAGFEAPEAFLTSLGKRYSAYVTLPGRNRSPISEVSRMAWVGLYKPADNHRNEMISYYLKGDMIGIALDLRIRIESAKSGKLGSLERMFRAIWASKAKGRWDVAIDYDDVVAAANAQAGADLRGFFEAHVRGTDPLPLPELLREIGVEVRSAPVDDTHWTGLVFSGKTVRSVERDSPAASAGMMDGDELVAVAGHRVENQKAFNEAIARTESGQPVEVSVFRKGLLKRIELVPIQHPGSVYTFTLMPEDTLEPAIAKARADWLRTTAKLP